MVSVNVLDGFPFPKHFDQENFYTMKNLELHPDDIIISTYQKCGTNWIAYIIWGLLHPNEDPPDGNRVFAEDIPFVDKFGLGRCRANYDGEPRSFTTHLPYRMLPKHEKAKFVVVVRNPFDCCVSFYHFTSALKVDYAPTEGQLIPNSYFEPFMSGNVWYGDYFEHLLDWYEHRNDENVHFIIFEDLKKDPKVEILNLARFLGLHQKLEEDDGRLLQKIIYQSSFDFMKSNVEYNVQDKEGKVEKYQLVRKGKVGGFRDELTEEQTRKLKEKMHRCLKGTTLLELWKDL